MAWYVLAPYTSLAVWLAACVGVTALSVIASAHGGRLWGEVDSGKIVIDEVAGAMWTMVLVPHGWQWAVAGFFAFRFYDILKPWPARYFDRKVKNGFGVTMDDVCAGLMACATLHLARLAL